MLISEVRDTPLAQAFVNAGAELGYDVVNMNGEESLGKYFYAFYLQHVSISQPKMNNSAAVGSKCSFCDGMPKPAHMK